jgi:hypothetical protein
MLRAGGVMGDLLQRACSGRRALLLAYPDVIVASDATSVFWTDGTHDSRQWPLPPGGSTQPRMSGAFTRSLCTMVRESGAWTMLEAFRRCA